MSVAPTFEVLRDRMDITDTLYRYASTIDVRDIAGLRAVLADDMWAQYGHSEPMVGGDTVAAWIDRHTVGCLWQHHLLSVYHIDLQGDHAKALIYHTSHQVFEAAPDVDSVIVARYHNELTRSPSGWKISRLVFEILWREKRTDVDGLMAASGGPGPVGIW